MSYCVPADLYSYGLPRGALPNTGRLAGSALASADTFEIDVHGLSLNDSVYFRAEAGGTLSSPLAEGTEYFAVPVTESLFSVAASSGGAVIDLTTNGSGVVVVIPLPVAAAISWASALIDDMLPGHEVPLTAPYPPIIVMTCAELAAGKLLGTAGAESRTLGDMVDQARKRLERWAKGLSIRGTNAPTPANVAVSATLPYSDARGWSDYGGIS